MPGFSDYLFLVGFDDNATAEFAGCWTTLIWHPTSGSSCNSFVFLNQSIDRGAATNHD